MTARGFDGLPEQIQAAATRIGAALSEPDLPVSAAQLLTASHDMDRLSARVRQAADSADLASRRHPRAVSR
jgi:hypothetical protein